MGIVAKPDHKYRIPGPLNSYHLPPFWTIYGACEFTFCSASLEEASMTHGPPPTTNHRASQIWRECYTITTDFRKGPLQVYALGDQRDCKQGQKLHMQDVYCPRSCDSFTGKRAGYLLFRPLGPYSYGVLGRLQPAYADHVPQGATWKTSTTNLEYHLDHSNLDIGSDEVLMQ